MPSPRSSPDRFVFINCPFDLQYKELFNAFVYDDAGSATPLLTPDECLRMPGPQKDEHDRITAAGDIGGLLRRLPGNLRSAAALFSRRNFRRKGEDSATKP